MVLTTKKSILILLSIIVLATIPYTFAHGATPQYVLLVPGYSLNGSPNYSDWLSGVNIYNQLVAAGYTVGLVSYYGSFVLNFSNGLSWTNYSFQGTVNTPIEQISFQLYMALQQISDQIGSMNLDIVAYSMGGLVTTYALENYNFNGIYINELITIATPFDGSPLATVAQYLGLNCLTGYQTNEMQSNSPFLQNLQNNWWNIEYKYPQLNFVVYAGNYDPWWGYLFFSGDNDGVVSVNSATYMGYNYFYTFPDLHTSSLDSFTWSGISYFQDQNLANTLISNLQGNF